MTPLVANVLLLFAAAIWGFAFVAQRVGMASVGPFTFNAVRFALGALSLLPLIRFMHVRRGERPPSRGARAPVRGRRLPVRGRGASSQARHARLRQLALGGGLLGTVLFFAASAQQLGIVTTTAGKAGFITGLYVILVPLLALFWGERATPLTWGGAVLAVAGLYFLSVTEEVVLSVGDAWVLLSAFLFAVQIQLLAYLTQRIDPLPLAAAQFAVCSLLSWGAALLTEEIAWAGLQQGLLPLLYGGLMSVGVAYTFQAVAQRHARPTPAAISMSLESAFAAFGGWLLLDEQLGARGGLGAALMMAGMVVAQIKPRLRQGVQSVEGRPVPAAAGPGERAQAHAATPR
jgi:drug/metabolite transporter (DMT)-like permease